MRQAAPPPRVSTGGQSKASASASTRGGPVRALRSGGSGISSHRELPIADEKDAWLTNLKGQIYLLTIENEMLKRDKSSSSSSSSSSFAQQQQQQSSSSSMLASSSATPRTAVPASPSGRIGGVAPPPPPPPSSSAFDGTSNQAYQLTTADLGGANNNLATMISGGGGSQEISDSFEVMRQKYAHLESKYQHDIEEARRAAEALASQCAAQSSLIATLKREIDAANENLTAQKLVVQRVEQKAAADIEVAQRDIDTLHERIVELQQYGDEKDQSIERLNVEIADLKHICSDLNIDCESAERARQATLDAYARQLIATRQLVRFWRSAKMQIVTMAAVNQELRQKESETQARADAAESEAANAKVTAVAAAQLREKATARSRELQRELEVANETIERLRTDLSGRDITLADSDLAIDDLQRRLDASLGAAAKAVHHKESSIRRAGELQSALTEKTFEADSLREAAVSAQHKEREVSIRAKALEEEVAQSHARVKALEHTEKQQDSRILSLTADVEALSQQLAAAEREIVPLRDELARRPPIDILRTLDVQNLMQRNSQAAAAIQGLMEWQQKNGASQ